MSIQLNQRWVLLLSIGLFFILWTSNSYAAGDTGLIQTITNKFESITQTWHSNLRPVVLGLFGTLITITLTYSAIKMTLRGADLPEIMTELVTMFLLFGLWLYIIENSITIVNAIMNSFNRAANIASGTSTNVRPGDIINTGVDLANAVIDQAGFWDTPIYGFLALVLFLAYLFIAGTLFVVLIESYVVTGVGIILLGFSGSPWTSDIAKKYLFFTFGVGIKLFTTIIVVRFGEGLVRGSLTVESEIKQIFAVVGVICLIAYLTNRIPAMAQGMISGASSSSPNDVRGIASSAGKVAAGTAIGALGTAAAVYQAHRAAKENMSGGSNSNPTLAAAAQAAGAGGASQVSMTPSSGKSDNNPNAIPNAMSSQNRGGENAKPEPAVPSNDKSEKSDKKSSDNKAEHSKNENTAQNNNAETQQGDSNSSGATSQAENATDIATGLSDTASSISNNDQSQNELSNNSNQTDNTKLGNTSQSRSSPIALANTDAQNGGQGSVIQSAVNQSPQATEADTAKHTRMNKALGYIRALSGAYARGSRDAMIERLTDPKIKNSAFDTAKKISENRISDKIKGKS